MKRNISVKVFDQEILISTEDPHEHVEKVSEFVNLQLESVFVKLKGVPPYKAALLAAMNIADEYLKYKNQQEALQKEVEEKSKKVLDLLEKY